MTPESPILNEPIKNLTCSFLLLENQLLHHALITCVLPSSLNSRNTLLMIFKSSPFYVGFFKREADNMNGNVVVTLRASVECFLQNIEDYPCTWRSRLVAAKFPSFLYVSIWDFLVRLMGWHQSSQNEALNTLFETTSLFQESYLREGLDNAIFTRPICLNEDGVDLYTPFLSFPSFRLKIIFKTNLRRFKLFVWK